MRLRSLIQTSAAAGAFALALGTSVPALAHDTGAPHDGQTNWDAPHAQPYQIDPVASEAWLADCRQKIGRRDSGVGGAVIGGLVGGVAGNRIAGRGDRTVGTVAGAAVGAAAGLAIDRAEDNGRTRDECEAYLDDYYARYQQGGYGSYGGSYASGYGYGGGYGANYGGNCCQPGPMMMAPITRQPVGEPVCTESVEYEYIDEPIRRAAPRPAPRPRPAPPSKRVPDKRIPMN